MKKQEYIAESILRKLMDMKYDLSSSPKSRMKAKIMAAMEDAEREWPGYVREQEARRQREREEIDGECESDWERRAE